MNATFSFKHRILFYLSPAGLAMRHLHGIGTKIKHIDIIDIDGDFPHQISETYCTEAPSSPWDKNTLEIYTSIYLSDEEMEKYKTGKASGELLTKIQDAIEFSKKMNQQWHPRPHTKEEIAEMAKKNEKDYHAARARLMW